MRLNTINIANIMLDKYSLNKKIDTLLNLNLINDFLSGEKSFLNHEDLFGIEVQKKIRRNKYKAYARFPVTILPKTRIVNYKKVIITDKQYIVHILFYLRSIIKEQRSSRLFEVYPYLISPDMPCGLYHYYIREHKLEKLPLIDKVNIKLLFMDKYKKKPKAYFIFSLWLSLLPKNNRAWWYREQLIELGCLKQRVIEETKKCKRSIRSVDFCDTLLNRFIGIDGVNESISSVLAIY